MDDANDEAADRTIDDTRRRSHRRAAGVETIVDRLDRLTSGLSYPVSTEAIAAEYADQVSDLPNETEDLGSALDRLEQGREFGSNEAVWDALVDEFRLESDETELDGDSGYDEEFEPDADVSSDDYEAAIPGDGGVDEYVDGSVDLPEAIKRELRERAARRTGPDEDSLGEID